MPNLMYNKRKIGFSEHCSKEMFTIWHPHNGITCAINCIFTDTMIHYIVSIVIGKKNNQNKIVKIP